MTLIPLKTILKTIIPNSCIEMLFYKNNLDGDIDLGISQLMERLVDFILIWLVGAGSSGDVMINYGRLSI